MPSIIAETMAAANLDPAGVVRWGQPVSLQRSGVYIVAMADRLDSVAGTLAECPISMAAVGLWLTRRPELLLDGSRPDAQCVAARLSRFWLPDEAILYIGQTTGELAARVGQYYATSLGAKRPHAGGHWLKTLSIIDRLYVHYAPSPAPEDAEVAMLQSFCEGVSDQTRATVHDPDHPFPFANLEWPKGSRWPLGNRKQHGLTGTRGL